jgi:hypothetical protein
METPHKLDRAMKEQFGEENCFSVVVLTGRATTSTPQSPLPALQRYARTQTVGALPQMVSDDGEGNTGEVFASFEKCIADAKRKHKTRKDDGKVAQWLAERRANSKTSQKRKVEKKALKSARYQYYDVRSPRGNIG